MAAKSVAIYVFIEFVRERHHNSALIALVGVLAGGYLNNFFGEYFKRLRDGQALAGALAGELASIR